MISMQQSGKLGAVEILSISRYKIVGRRRNVVVNRWSTKR